LCPDGCERLINAPARSALAEYRARRNRHPGVEGGGGVTVVPDLGDCEAYVLAMAERVFVLVYRGQPVAPLVRARALVSARPRPADYLTVFLGGGGRHERARQELAKQPLSSSMVLAVDDVDLDPGLGAEPTRAEVARAAEQLSDYYGRALSLQGRWVEELSSAGVGSSRLVWVGGDGGVATEPGVGSLWVLPRSRVAAWEALRGALATGGGWREASWDGLMRFADRVAAIRRRYGLERDPVGDLEYWVGAVVALRGTPPEVDVAGWSRQVLPLSEEQASTVTGGQWAGGHPDLLAALSDDDSVAVVRYGSGGLRPARRALVVARPVDGVVSQYWVELDSGVARATRLAVGNDGDWRVRVLRNPDTRVWLGRPRDLGTAEVQGAGDQDGSARSVAVRDDLQPLDSADFVRPRSSREERWALYDRMLGLALRGELSGAQVRELSAGVRGEVVGEVDYGRDNAKIFAGIALLLDTPASELRGLTTTQRYRDLLTSLSGCDVGPAEKVRWIGHMRVFRDLGLRLGRFGAGHRQVLDEMTSTWVDCGGAR
jgi:hypothetical protein